MQLASSHAVRAPRSPAPGRGMGSIRVPYLTRRGADRWFFQPRSQDRTAGWKAVRLCDAHGVPIADPIAAAEACAKCAAIYRRWREGDRSVSADWIDANGHVKEPAAELPAGRKRKTAAVHYAPGTLGAIITDYRNSKNFSRRKERTQAGYKSCLDLAVAAWGDTQWRRLSPKQARDWIELVMEESGLAYGHQVMRVLRAVLNKSRLLYESKTHPGIVPELENPFRKLDVRTPEGGGLPWPAGLVETFVQFCDTAGRPSIGDLVAVNCWTAQRITEFLPLPADRFRSNNPLWVDQGKTRTDVVIPWQIIDAVSARVAAAEQRRKERGVVATTFVYDDRTGLPFTERGFNKVFGELRALFCGLLAMDRADGTARWPTDYLAKCFDDDPFALDVTQLEARALRHTAITLYADAGVPPAGISAISGHEESSILTILKRYRKRTKTRAARAITQRLNSENGKA